MDCYRDRHSVKGAQFPIKFRLLSLSYLFECLLDFYDPAKQQHTMKAFSATMKAPTALQLSCLVCAMTTVVATYSWSCPTGTYETHSWLPAKSNMKCSHTSWNNNKAWCESAGVPYGITNPPGCAGVQRSPAGTWAACEYNWAFNPVNATGYTLYQQPRACTPCAAGEPLIHAHCVDQLNCYVYFALGLRSRHPLRCPH